MKACSYFSLNKQTAEMIRLWADNLWNAATLYDEDNTVPGYEEVERVFAEIQDKLEDNEL